MTANLFGNRFYGNREPAWHKMGYVSDVDHTATDALAILGSYATEKRPVIVWINDTYQNTGDYAIVRSPVPDDPIERCFGYCSEKYNILQPDTICQLFDDNVKQPVETLGMLGLGEKLFVTWKLPKIDVIGDEVDTYGFVACGYDGKFGASLSVVTTRVVCQNTFTSAINESLSRDSKARGAGRVYNGKHNSVNVERDLGIWMEHVQKQAESKVNSLQAQFVKMAQTKVDDSETLANLLFNIYPDKPSLSADYPEKLKAEKQQKIDAENEKASNSRIAVESLFNGGGTAIDATAWGLFNSVTEYENWGRPSKKAVEYSVLMGNRAATMQKAFTAINDWISK